MEENYELELSFNDNIPINDLGLEILPKPEMILYGINEQYFRNIQDLIKYCKKNMFSDDYIKHCAFKVSYLRNYAGCNDVFIKTFCRDLTNPINNSYSLLLTAIDENRYGAYDYRKSIEKSGNIWNYVEGSLREMHKAFRHRGIEFENDIYLKIDEGIKKPYKYTYKKTYIKEENI